MEVLRRQFERHFGSPPLCIEPVQGGLGGSGRTIVRLANERSSAIGVVNDVRAENAAFLGFSRHFRRHGLPVPEIYAEDLAAGAYLQEDLGETTLFDFLRRHRTGAPASPDSVAPDYVAPEVVEMYRRAVEVLPRFQVEAGRDLNYRLCYPRSSFDRQSIAWDLNYFKYYFLRLAGVPFHEEELEKDFSRLARFLLTAERRYFLYRDFQSRNIMVRRLQRDEAQPDATQPNEAEPWFIDYQGGRRGALQYDIASLLFDAKADLPPALRHELLEHYLDALAELVPLDREAFLRHYHAYVYVRVMQALGAYGFRGYYERKPHFLESVPYALKNVRWLLANAELPVKLPALMAAFAAMTETARTEAASVSRTAEAEAAKSAAAESDTAESAAAAPAAAAAANQAGPGAAAEKAVLTVVVSSFSFHRGPVVDESGHGGGFVFDARALPNPGREERFRRLSGQDAAVIEYLNRQPGVEQFLSSAMEMVEASVREYQRRGFRQLMVSFGCTGGQHRSVFLAEQAAKRLDGRDGLRVVLRHREQENWVR